jgi:hypothetical protein
VGILTFTLSGDLPHKKQFANYWNSQIPEPGAILRGVGFEANTVSDEKLDYFHDTML